VGRDVGATCDATCDATWGATGGRLHRSTCTPAPGTGTQDGAERLKNSVMLVMLKVPSADRFMSLCHAPVPIKSLIREDLH
jgi:hypothetical protein